MKKMLFSCFVFLLSSGLVAQSTHLEGDIKISLNEGKLDSDFRITNYAPDQMSLSFMINSKIKIKTVKLNSEKISVTKTKASCYDCHVYEVSLPRKLVLSDTIGIQTKGTFKHFKAGTNKSDYKGRIASNYGILRASEQAKWYPVLTSKDDKLPSFARKHAYTYNLKVNCEACKGIYVGAGLPQKSGSQFVGQRATKDIMLIAGDISWAEGENAIFINVPDEKMRKRLDSLFSSIVAYYQQLTQIKMPTKYVLASLPSDNKRWGGFMTYPTIVSVRKKIGDRGLASYLSHEVAHYLFGDVYRPEGNLFWFYLESFAEYYSFKYLLEHEPSAIKGSYRRLKKSDAFVRLDQVQKFSEVTGSYRYLIGPFQLLALEEQLGEAKMLALIKAVFPKLKNAENGYQAMMESLVEIGVEQAVIANIEARLFKAFNVEEYQFVASRLEKDGK